MLNAMFLKGCLKSIVLKLRAFNDSLQTVIDYTRVMYWAIAYFPIVLCFQTNLGKGRKLKVKSEPVKAKGQGSDSEFYTLVGHFRWLRTRLVFWALLQLQWNINPFWMQLGRCVVPTLKCLITVLHLGWCKYCYHGYCFSS